ncbi:MAG TPA: hypothetical protein VFA75_02530 [Nevskia sp.]|nr:hypothetical protein [Nevskia sp.]
MNIATLNTDHMYDLALKVQSKGDLERFIEHLADDYEVNHEVWENHSVPDFLMALADCSRRSGERGTGSTSLHSTPEFWQHMARMLLGATVLR